MKKNTLEYIKGVLSVNNISADCFAFWKQRSV